MFNKILIANRGEIACRIIRSCQALGIETVAVYSLADQNSPHVEAANYSVCLGSAQSSGSYLNMEAILQAALQEQCQAIHPGYGFLAENRVFSFLCQQYGITFIGPDSEMIRQMGDKSQARKIMTHAGLEIVPGSEGTVADPKKEASRIGYPLLLKASHGGGGKGMRVCNSVEELEKNFAEASLEAEKAFGNAEIYVEKFIEKGKHIEFQIIADNYGNVIHLGERECSIQRNHQKLIEEAPSPVLSPELRQQVGDQVVQAIKKIGYTNAGTIEFLMDNKNHLYFMEMNTRLQVEHPVTEMISGIDLVEQQIKIAANHPLAHTQESLSFQGHAIECRINAENPLENFKPSPGQITRFVPPPKEPYLRLDTHVQKGYVIPPFYDSMIGKLIIHGENREQAIERMIEALEKFIIEGVYTTIPLHLKILRSEDFRSGKYDTKFIDRLLKKST